MTTSHDSSAVLMDFIQSKVSANTDIHSLTIFCKDFNFSHPEHAAAEMAILARIRRVLNQIDHTKYDNTTLAKMMFFLGQRLASDNLEQVCTRLKASGELVLDNKRRIIYYKNEEVELEQDHGSVHRRYRARAERTRRESQQRQSSEVDDEARESGEGAKAMKEVKAEDIWEQLYGPNGIRRLEESNEPSTSDCGRQRVVENDEVRAPFAKRARVGVSGIIPQGNVQSTLSAASRPQIRLSSVLLNRTFPSQNALGTQEPCYNYSVVLKSIRDLTFALENKIFKTLREEIVEELQKPESASKKVLEKTIEDALRYGIENASRHAKADNIQQSIALIEFVRLLKLQLFNIGFENENGLVTEITEIINQPSQGLMVSLAKVRFAIEYLFIEIDQ